MRDVVNDIRSSVNLSVDNSTFIFGRSFDTALDAIHSTSANVLVYLDPVQWNGGINDSFENAQIQMVFLTQDAADSNFDETQNEIEADSTEEIFRLMKKEAETWLNYFNDNYSYYQLGNYTMLPAIKIKNVCSGVFVQLTLTYKKPCD